MTKKILLSLALVGIITTAAVAVNPGGRTSGLRDTPLGQTISGCIGRLMTLRSDLNVTTEQREKVREVIGNHKAEIASTVKSVRDQRVALRDLARTGTASDAQIKAAADALGQAISDAAVKAVQLHSELAPILDKDQRATVGEFLEKNDAAINAFLEAAITGN